MKNKSIKCYLVLGNDGKIKYPTCAVFDTLEEARYEVKVLNQMSGFKPKYKVVKGLITWNDKI